MRRTLIALIAPTAVLAVLALPACERAAGGSGDGEDSGPPEPGGTVVVGVISEPDNLLDVTSTAVSGQQIIDQMFLSLVEVQEDFLSFEPALARSWETGDDGRSVTFHLEPEARWHDGVPVTAEDVKFTHDLHVDPLVGYPARSWKSFIAGVDVIDAHTVTFRFDRQYAYQVMDANVGAILPKHLLEGVPRGELGSCEFARHPVGDGPFRFEKWDAQQAVHIVANDDYFGGRPYLDRVVFRMIPDKTNQLTQLETGEIDVMEDVPPHEVQRLETSVPGIVLSKSTSRTYTYIGWDSTNPLFASKRVRRALTMAIDRQGIIDALCYGYARPALGPIHPILWAYNENLPVIPYDPEAAAAILAEEGWRDTDGDGVLDRDGARFEFELKTNIGNQVREDAAVIIQSQLAKVGIRVKPRTYEWTVLWDSVIRHSYGTAVLVGWNVSLKVDLKPTFHTSSLTGKYNHTGYSNPEVDQLIDRALAMKSLEETKPLWDEVQEKIVEDQPYTFLLIPDRIFGVNERVRGTAPDARGFYVNLEKWWIPASKRRHRTGV